MSSDHAIGAPFTLASLPKPIASSGGRVHATAVCSVSGIKKRKRTEIVAGLDGEGVSIYSLQNPQLVTSYALPPSAIFTTAPYSIYRKGAGKTPAQRFTYASLAGATSSDKAQLICFREKISGDQTETLKTSYIPSNATQLIALESLPVLAGGSSKDATHDIIATFDNGDIICLSADLDTVNWVGNLTSLIAPSHGKVEIEQLTVATAKAVTRGLIRNREDIIAILNPSLNEASDILDLTQVLCLIGRKADGTRILSLISIQPRSADLATVQLSPLKQLVAWNLPQSSTPSTATGSTATSPQYFIHSQSGAVYCLIDGILLSYDLTGTIPKLSSELTAPGLAIDSFLRVSQDSIFTTSQGNCRVFDVKYNSLQAALSLAPDEKVPISTSPSKKRKHTPSTIVEVPSAYVLLAYFVEQGLVVATRDNEIIGMQFAGIAPRKRVKTTGTLLIDALGKGLLSQKPANGHDAHKWQERKAKLNRYARKGKITQFEEAFATDLGIQLDSADLDKRRESEVKGGPLTNGVGPSIPDEDVMAIDGTEDESAELRTWKLPRNIPNDKRQQYRKYALFALSKIFRWEDAVNIEGGSQGSLRIVFFPPNVFQWLLHTGHLTKDSIRRSFLDETPELIQSISSLADGDIIKAIVEFDTDLHILSAVLNHNHFLPVSEVVQAIRLLIQSLDDASEDNTTTKLLTNGTDHSDVEMDVDIISELDAASHEIDHALSILDHGLLTRSHTLRPALIRLHTFPGPVISATLRSILPRKDLESLIRLLHLELKNGGWSSSYDFADLEASIADLSSEDPDDHAVAIIASLLSSTLDAIGAGAWLASVGTVDASETSEDIIEALHNDTSEALNGFWEARFMRGLLSEFLRFATTLPKSQKPSNKTLQRQGKPFTINGKLERDEDLPMLPLGGKADMGVERTKKGHNGKREERSKREMGLLISKRVPKYSFERIVI
ncbi:hypothetical protein ACN47E_001960 [Coniothyrium glycines]